MAAALTEASRVDGCAYLQQTAIAEHQRRDSSSFRRALAPRVTPSDHPRRYMYDSAAHPRVRHRRARTRPPPACLHRRSQRHGHTIPPNLQSRVVEPAGSGERGLAPPRIVRRTNAHPHEPQQTQTPSVQRRGPRPRSCSANAELRNVHDPDVSGKLIFRWYRQY